MKLKKKKKVTKSRENAQRHLLQKLTPKVTLVFLLHYDT